MNKKFLSLFVGFAAVLTAVAGNSADFKAALAKVDKGGEYLAVSSSLDAAQNWVKFLSALPPDKTNIGGVLGARLQKAFGTLLVKAQASSSIEAAPGCWVFKNYQYTGKENMHLPSLFQLLDIPDKKLDFAQLPADTVFAISGEVNIAGIYKLLYDEFTSKEDMFKTFFQQIPVLAKQRGIELDTMLDSISGNWKLLIAGTNPGDLLVNIEIPDKNGALAAFIRKELNLPANAKEGVLPLFFMPVRTTFAGSKVILSTPPTNRKIKTTLAETPDFANYIANIGDSGIGYSLINITPQLIAVVKSFIPAQIAPAIKLAPFSALGLLKHDPAGAYSVAASNVSGTKMVTVGTTSVLTGILLPALNQAREKARMAVCVSNLKWIGTGLHLYAKDHKDLFPTPNGVAGLQKLIDGKYVDAKVFSCQSKPVSYKDNKLSAQCPYIYIGGIVGNAAKVQKPSQLPVVFEKPNHKQSCPVAFADGHVETLTIKPVYNNPNQVIGVLSKRFKYAPELLDKMLKAVMEN
ncbi:MAG: DUF1559 domain-containing protein [Lentisphaerae bacterium]|nr:DUF1559 domain-containing protein [Lentisphaerota bacterium]